MEQKTPAVFGSGLTEPSFPTPIGQQHQASLMVMEIVYMHYQIATLLGVIHVTWQVINGMILLAADQLARGYATWF